RHGRADAVSPQSEAGMTRRLFQGGTLILADRLLVGGSLETDGSRIVAIHEGEHVPADGSEMIDLAGGYLSPGFIDLHVHGGAGADFMDGTVEAFRTVCQAHARHGTTALLPTSTVARRDQLLTFLGLCRRTK